jgi:RNA polymerase sigma-B factor
MVVPAAAGDEAAITFELAVRHAVHAQTHSPETRRWLAEHYAPLADRLARRMYRGGDLADDIRQVAHEHLLRALDRFEPERGVPFEAYATPVIVGAIKRYYRDHGWAMRVPRRVHEMAGPIADTAELLSQQLGRSPTPQQLADALDINVEDLLEILESIEARQPTSIEVGWPEEPRADVDPIGTAVDRLALDQALAELSERDREILDLAFAKRCSQVQIAEQFGVSQMQVSRWLNRALGRLRDRIV